MALYLSNSTRTRATSPERSKHALASTVRLPHTDPLRHSHSHSHAQSQRHRQCHCQSPQSPQSPPWSPPLEPLKRPRGAPLVGQRLLSPPPPSLLGDPLCVGTCGGSPPAHLLRALSTPRNFQSMAGGSQMSLVVVAVDDGPYSLAAFRRALNIFPKETTHFHIVHVRPDETEYRLDDIYSVGIREHWEELEAGRKKMCKAVLDKFRALAAKAGIKYTIVELHGDARHELCQYCTTSKADVLVLGSRSAGFLSRLLLGSVSTYCAHHAPCAVLIDHKDGTEGPAPTTTQPAVAASPATAAAGS